MCFVRVWFPQEEFELTKKIKRVWFARVEAEMVVQRKTVKKQNDNINKEFKCKMAKKQRKKRVKHTVWIRGELVTYSTMCHCIIGG